MEKVHELQKKILKLQNTEGVNSIFSKMISGKQDYKTIIEMKREPQRCKNCDLILDGNEKFCPECGEKVEKETEEAEEKEGN